MVAVGNVAAVADLYLFDPGGDPEERARHKAEREAQRASVRDRYTRRVIEQAGIDEITAELVMASLFDHYDADGEECVRGTHPLLPKGGEHSHDAGFDCPCTWDGARRAAEAAAQKRWWDEYSNSTEARALAAHAATEQAEIDRWIAEHRGVTATRTTTCAPEQWEGVVDGRSFYFRQRDGLWSIEVDLKPNGHLARRVVGTDADGEFITEPVELTSGVVIAEGAETACGESAVEHLAFIVTIVRNHITGETCRHEGAGWFCPSCGKRMLDEA